MTCKRCVKIYLSLGRYYKPSYGIRDARKEVQKALQTWGNYETAAHAAWYRYFNWEHVRCQKTREASNKPNTAHLEELCWELAAQYENDRLFESYIKYSNMIPVERSFDGEMDTQYMTHQEWWKYIMEKFNEAIDS